MRENKIVKIGGELLMLKQVSFRVFRRLHLTRNSIYLCYYDGQKYYKFKKENALPAIKKQIILFCEQELTIPEESFAQKMGFLPVYFFNNLLLLDRINIPEDNKAWFLALKAFLDGKKIPKLSISLRPKHILIDRMGISKKGQREPALVGKGSTMLWLWLYKVIEGKIQIKICEEQTCERIFLPSRSDQRFCSDVHRRKSLVRRNKVKVNV